MGSPTRRDGALDTASESMGWLQSNPALIGHFLAVGVILGLGQTFGLFSIVGVLGLLYVGGITHLVARDEFAATTPDRGAASFRVGRRMGSLVGVSILTAVLVGIALVLFVLPGIYVALRLSLAPAACVIDEKDALSAIAESWHATQGNVLTLLGLAGFFAIGLFAAFLLTMPILFLVAELAIPDFVASTASVAVCVTAYVPLIELGIAHVYLQNRRPESGFGTTERFDRETGIAGA